MIQFRIHGRGGQGGVTLAKILAYMYWKSGKFVQAFGSYSAERTGAPVLAFTLVDDNPVTSRCKVFYPDHLVVLDPSLIKSNVLEGLHSKANLLIDSPKHSTAFTFPGRRITTIDAKSIALKYRLGTQTTPITNTALAGAFARLFDLDFSYVEQTIKELHFPGINTKAAREAFDSVVIGEYQPGDAPFIEPQQDGLAVPSFINGNIGDGPELNVADWKSKEPFYAQQRIPPCNFQCPAGNRVQGFIEKLMVQDYDGALAVLRETTPLPGSTARVCPHPCESNCNRKDVDERINIHALERMAADKGHWFPIIPAIENDKKVAVIGSGPAGISAAFHLRKKGYKPIIFESLPEPGGMLRSGIPSYRLPREVLSKEISYLVESGIEIRCNHSVTSPSQFAALLDNYDAIIIAVGLSVGKPLKLAEKPLENIFQGVDFLKKVNFGETVILGGRVIVIGGGNTAIDAARTAIRCGAGEVQIVYRRTKNEMPAIVGEITEAVDEGIYIKELFSPYCVIDHQGSCFLRVQKMKLGDTGSDGRQTPVPIEGEFEELAFSTLILATGQQADLGFLRGKTLEKAGRIQVNRSGQTPEEKIFAAGDVATGEGTVTHALGRGREVAESVDAFLQGKELPRFDIDENEVVYSERMKLTYFKLLPRMNYNQLPPKQRVESFDEVNFGLELPGEALRCMSCGICNGCMPGGRSECQLFCPERVISKTDVKQLEINYSGCKGCLICESVCPRYAIGHRPTLK